MPDFSDRNLYLTSLTACLSQHNDRIRCSYPLSSCHPGGGRDPPLRKLLLLIAFSRSGGPGIARAAEPWIPAFAGMTEGWTARLKQALRDPPSYGYPALPPNWESADQIAKNKPSTQTFARLFQQVAFGGVADDPSQSGFTTVPYPGSGGYSIGVAPYSYWRRALDSYTQVMNQVDAHIGAVVTALPPAVAQNTVIVLTSDHGDFAGAHGFASGKAGTCYEEIWKVPLIVVDPTGQFTGDIDTIRNQLTSSIDLLPLLVSLGHNGSRDWITGDLAGLYGRRHDMIPLLRSASAPGRQHVVFATDELVPAKYTFDNPKFHLVGLIADNAKLGVYAHWLPATTMIDTSSIEIEFYDYDTPGGRAEVDNIPDDRRAKGMLETLLNDIIPGELQAPLPLRFRPAQDLALAKYLVYAALVGHLGVLDTGLIVGL